MEFTPEQLLENWDIFMSNIENHISEPRQTKLSEFYRNLEDRLVTYPASHKPQYHNCMVGGYIDHVNRVVKASLSIYTVWEQFGVDTTTFTKEELVFAAINHDLGKIGDLEHDAYIPQTDEWRKKKLDEHYTFNTKLPFASVPDRGLFLLQQAGIPYTFNEMIGIQVHDGLYDEANKKYYIGWAPEQKFRTSMPFILHQADLLAARIEFEKEWLPKFKDTSKNNVDIAKKPFILNTNSKKTTTSSKAMKGIQSKGLNSALSSMLDNISDD